MAPAGFSSAMHHVAGTTRVELHVDFALVRGPRPVQRVFEMTGMERFVPAVDAA